MSTDQFSGLKRHHVTDRALDSEKAFLSDLPPDATALLAWFEAGSHPEQCSPTIFEWARSLLCELSEDEAIIPKPYGGNEPHCLALLLTHHLRNPGHCVAWLNLGLALRRIAISDPDDIRVERLVRAIVCLDRSLTLGQTQRPVAIRAWAGKAFAFTQLGTLDEAVRCSAAALELDRSDPNLWLLHAACIARAGNENEALGVVEGAYAAYIAAGRPAALRYLFDQHGSQTADRQPDSQG